MPSFPCLCNLCVCGITSHGFTSHTKGAGQLTDARIFLQTRCACQCLYTVCFLFSRLGELGDLTDRPITAVGKGRKTAGLVRSISTGSCVYPF